MATANDVDVLIVGAGPTGLALAAQLARYRADFRIVDSGRGATDLSKAIGVQARTLETLDLMGLADELVEQGTRARAFNALDDGRQIARIDFTSMATRFPFLLVVPQSSTERAFIGAIGAERIERATSLVALEDTGAHVRAVLRHEDGLTEAVRARWVVGCDGAHSTVRAQVGFAFQGVEYEEGFLLADLKVDWSRPADELFLFLRDGWLTGFFPLPDGTWRVVADLPPEQAPVGQGPSLEDCQRLVDQRLPERAVLHDAVWTAYYRVHRRIVPQMQSGAVFLAGDAAHIHSPAAAQGMNTGIQDAFNLGWKLAYVARGDAPQTLLTSYGAERYPVERAVLRNTDLLLRGASIRRPLPRKLRDALVSLATQHTALQRRLPATVAELAVSYPDSPAIPQRGGARPSGGERAPDITAERADGRPWRLYEALRSGRFAALAFAGRQGFADGWLRGVQDALAPVRHVADLCAVSGSPDAGVGGAWSALADREGAARRSYHADGPGLVLVRPDGYVALRADGDRALASTEDVARCLRGTGVKGRERAA